MAHDVFISYAAQDIAVAEAARTALEARGMRCRLAPRGADEGETDLDDVASARAVVALLSGDANGSAEVKREVGHAVATKRPMVVVRIDDVQPSGALASLSRTPHWLDARSAPFEKHLNDLGNGVSGLLDQEEAKTQRSDGLPSWLLDRRAVVAGVGLVVGVAVFSIFAAENFMTGGAGSPSPPAVGEFAGSWTARRVALPARTLQDGDEPFATDVFAHGAAEVGALTGELTVDGSGYYTYRIAAVGGGTVSVADGKITFTPDLGRPVHTFDFAFMDAPTPENIMDFDEGGPQSKSLMLGPTPGYRMSWMEGQPSGEPPVGEWRFKTNGMRTPDVTLTIGADGRYRFRVFIEERGLWSAADGRFSRTRDDARGSATGTYQFHDAYRVSWTDADGTIAWTRVTPPANPQ